MPAASPCSPEKLLEEARQVVGGRGIGARLALSIWRKSAIVPLRDQASNSEVGNR
jgi:hypothetical protein